MTTVVAEYPNVTYTTPTLESATETLTNNKLHFKKTLEAQS
jgi:hypothetical protein